MPIVDRDRSIAFLLGNLTGGGSETKVVRLANRLASRKFDIHIIYLGEPHTLRSQIAGEVAVLCLNRLHKFSFNALWTLKNYIATKGIKAIVCINPYPLIYGWPVGRWLKRKRVRCLAAINTLEFLSARDARFMIIYAYFLRRCDLVIFGSNRQRQLWTVKYGIRSDKCTLISNGVDSGHFTPGITRQANLRESLEISDQSVVIGCVAQLRPEKCHENLLIALGRLVNCLELHVVLVLVGDGPEERRLREITQTEGLSDYVRFVGRVDDVRPYLGLMDVFVLPSTTEVFSNAILEAMATGLPVVCSDVGGADEIIEHGESGFTYPVHDIDKLVDYLHVLVRDPEKRKAIGTSAVRKVSSEFSVEQMDSKYIELLWAAKQQGP